MHFVVLIDLLSDSGRINWVSGDKWLCSDHPVTSKAIDLSPILAEKMLLVEDRVAVVIQTKAT